MNIHWSKEAEDSFNEIVDWYIENMGWQAAEKFADAVRTRINLLIQNPNLAPLEERLKDKARPYRSLSDGKHCLIIYYTENDSIYIAYIWNCRQNPDALISRIKL